MVETGGERRGGRGPLPGMPSQTPPTLRSSDSTDRDAYSTRAEMLPSSRRTWLKRSFPSDSREMNAFPPDGAGTLMRRVAGS